MSTTSKACEVPETVDTAAQKQEVVQKSLLCNNDRQTGYFQDTILHSIS